MENGAAPLLEIRGLKTWFETPAGMARAADGVSITVDAGEAVGIVGESGSGKTQTLHSVFGLSMGWPGVVAGSARLANTEILAGLNEHVSLGPTTNGDTPVVRKNTQRWDAIQHARLQPILGRDVAMMFQDARRSLVPYWTIRRHLLHVLRRRDAALDHETEARAQLERFGFRDTAHILDAFPEQLSGGEAQRAMLALAMAMKPRLLIVTNQQRRSMP